jgi:hypothetical protein
MKHALACLLFLLAASAAAGTSTTLKPTTTDNDDSCDISLLPAATLLVPYFEVDFRTPQVVARTTIFTIQNTTAMPQIARVTLWTNWSDPMLTFNVFLTGYDVQGINLYDVFARGSVAPSLGTSGGTSNQTPVGTISLQNDQNPHFLPDAAFTCSSNPGPLGAALLADLQTAFTSGKIAAPGCTVSNQVGSVHVNAIGYATIDVVADCNSTSPIAPEYFTREILFDNVLTGDVQHINPNPATGNYAGGNPLVHIRAIPEGGAAGAFVATNLPYTFYDLYTPGAPGRTQDRRQPLPSAFMPRFIEGGTGEFNTNLQIWREAIVAPTTCPLAYRSNSNMTIAENIRFDEHENSEYWRSQGCVLGGCVPNGLPSTAAPSTASAFFPSHSTSGDVGGWLYLNLNNGGSSAYSAERRNYRFGTTTGGPRQSQGWVVTSMYAEGRYAVEMDALPVGNGCSPAPDLSTRSSIGPAPNAAPISMPTSLKPTTIDNDDSCDIALLPAATLLLPYFEVDPVSPPSMARTTLFTIQNTTAMPQIARVTLWTDWSYPMLTFNVFLTGYDLQSINLYDILARGEIAPSGIFFHGGTSNTTRPGTLSLANDQNPHFLPDANTTCANNPGDLDAALVTEMQSAFRIGKITAPGCATVNLVGGTHPNAIGYATVDVVANCRPTSPLAPDYFAKEILFDNVLTGDYQHLNPNPATGNYAGGNPLVHIHAIPEGGAAGAFAVTNLPFTFYDLYTAGAPFRTQDRRQPLPSAFMPRFIQGATVAFNTNLQIWREAIAAPTACPLAYASNSAVPFAEGVRFDEHENPTYDTPACGILCPPTRPGIPSASSLPGTSTILPPLSQSGDVAGWLFLNANNGGSPAYSPVGNGRRPSQAWVVTSMFAEGRYAVEMDAAAVGNGCSPAPELATKVPIGPAPNPNP